MAHILKDSEVRELFLNKLDTHALHICTNIKIVEEDYEWVWDWDIIIHKNIYDENGLLSKEYFSDKNKPIFDSSKLNEYEIYAELRELIEKYPKKTQTTWWTRCLRSIR